MATQQYGLLEDHEEQALHKSRLLNVEEKPFKRLTKRLIAPGAFTNPNPKKLLTPPPDADSSSQDASVLSPTTTDVTALKEDITLDFAAFDSSIARLQFLATANAAERERYAADRLRISETMESVRSNNATLRVQLDEAKGTLAQRKKFDELADKITSNRMLRTRQEQQVNLAKLAEECEELEKESQTYGSTWRDRKEQFDKLVEEGTNLRKLIRDEKEEAERREGMDEDGEQDDGTPGKSDNATPRRSDDNATPRPSSSHGRSPRPDHDGDGGGEGLKAHPEPLGSFSRGESQAPSEQAGSQAQKDETEEGEDVEMGESTRAADTPQIKVDAPENNGDKMDTT